MGEKPKCAKTVVEADPDNTRFLNDLGHVGLVRAAVDKSSPVYEHIDRQLGVGGDVRRPPHVDEEAIFRFRSRAVWTRGGGAIRSKAFASRMSFQLSAGCGGRQRLPPTGGAP